PARAALRGHGARSCRHPDEECRRDPRRPCEEGQMTFAAILVPCMRDSPSGSRGDFGRWARRADADVLSVLPGGAVSLAGKSTREGGGELRIQGTGTEATMRAPHALTSTPYDRICDLLPYGRAVDRVLPRPLPDWTGKASAPRQLQLYAADVHLRRALS